MLKLVERLNVPVASTLLGKSVIREDHPLYVGVYGGLIGRDDVQQFVNGSDCLLILGTHLTDIEDVSANSPLITEGRTVHATSDRVAVKHHRYENVRFDEFVRFCAREFGGEVDWWCTINEPEVYAFRSYSEGRWPPAERDDSAALAVIANMLEAHGRAYRILHAEDRRDADGDGRPAVVGFAKAWVALEPLRPWSPLDWVRAWFEDAVFNRAVARAAVTGEIQLRIPGARGVRRKVPELAKSLDYFGLNHYTRWKVDALAPDPHVAAPGARLTDLGWEIHPGGFEEALVGAAAQGVPVLVTENGFADQADAFRPRALIEYLLAMGRVIDRGARVIGYLHWSLIDNFEWADGFRPRFGLYGVDFDRPERPRQRRKSADLYARIARANGITPEMLAEVGLTG